MAKNKRIYGNTNTSFLRSRLKTTYMNKYYNLYMNLFDWEGLDKEQRHYVMKKLWANGTVAAFVIKNINEIGFCPYAATAWNMYDFAEKVTLINERGVPFIPNSEQVVEKDVVLGFAQYNHKSVKEICEYYIDRMVQVDMVINTNLNVHKLPFIVKCSPEDAKKLEDLLQRVLDDETAIFTDLEDVVSAGVLQGGAQYIIDKLYAYRVALENELLSYLGIDNTGASSKATTETLDEVNANNALINLGQDQFITNIEEFTDSIKEVFGITIKATIRTPKAEETYESRNRADAYENRQEKRVEETAED